MMKIDSDGILFYAPDSFDRGVTYATATCDCDVANYSDITACAYKPVMKGSVGC